MLKRTYLSKEERTAPGFKAAKDHMTLLLGGNASGELKFKPLVVYHSQTPRAMKGYSKAHLPVVWRANKKGWVTRTVFQEWFISYFKPAVEQYYHSKNLENKTLLILDNAPGHPPNLEDFVDNVEVIFLPPNTTCLIQPMDQGVIATFKAYHLRRTFSEMIKFLNGDAERTPREFWHDYHIMKAIDNLAEACKEVKPRTMKLAWREIHPELFADMLTVEQPLQNAHQDIAELAHHAGFSEVNEADIVELLQSHEEDLSNEDLMEMEQQRAHDGKDDELGNEEPQRFLTAKDLSEAFDLLDKAMAIFTEKDPQRERSSEANRIIMSGYKCYRVI
uniref:DDE-1 domain-containing protein n=1 Tax=Trichuris muris TaxID=70415 RepID=A0A5S6QK23_TRIMR